MQTRKQYIESKALMSELPERKRGLNGDEANYFRCKRSEKSHFIVVKDYLAKRSFKRSKAFLLNWQRAKRLGLVGESGSGKRPSGYC
jgi:peptide/nickel transport system ATP-binding protein